MVRRGNRGFPRFPYPELGLLQDSLCHRPLSMGAFCPATNWPNLLPWLASLTGIQDNAEPR